jgi:hypothetical protein
VIRVLLAAVAVLFALLGWSLWRVERGLTLRRQAEYRVCIGEAEK